MPPFATKKPPVSAAIKNPPRTVPAVAASRPVARSVATAKPAPATVKPGLPPVKTAPAVKPAFPGAFVPPKPAAAKPAPAATAVKSAVQPAPKAVSSAAAPTAQANPEFTALLSKLRAIVASYDAVPAAAPATAVKPAPVLKAQPTATVATKAPPAAVKPVVKTQAVVTPAAAAPGDLDSLNRMSLVALAKERGVAYEGLKVEDLRAALKAAEEGGGEAPAGERTEELEEESSEGEPAAEETEATEDDGVTLDPLHEAKATTLMELLATHADNPDVVRSIEEMGCGGDCMRCPGPEFAGDALQQIDTCHASLHPFLGVEEPVYE